MPLTAVCIARTGSVVLVFYWSDSQHCIGAACKIVSSFLVASFFSLFCCFPMKLSVLSACVSVFSVMSTQFFRSHVYINNRRLINRRLIASKHLNTTAPININDLKPMGEDWAMWKKTNWILVLSQIWENGLWAMSVSFFLEMNNGK